MAENKYISELSGNTNPSLTGYTVYDDGTSTYKLSLQTLKNSLFSASSSYATLSGNTFQGSQTINGNLIVTGSITAQQYVVSSSVYHITETTVSGSSNFGNSLDDTHIFTGSLKVTGSITSSYFVGNGSQLTNLPLSHLATTSSLNSVSNSVNTLISQTSSYLTSLPSGIISGSSQLPSGIVSGSSQLPSGIVSGSSQISNLGFAITGSNLFLGNQTIRGTVIIGTGSLHGGNHPEVLSVANSGSFNIAYFTGNSNTHTQINIQNVSNNSGASTDLVLTADNGSETNHYINLGINSSGWLPQTASIGHQNDGYLYNVGQDLYIGTMEPASADHGHLYLFSSNSWENPQITISSEKTIAFNTGSVTTGYTYEFSGSVKLQDELSVDGSVTANNFTGSLNYSNLINVPALISGSSQIFTGYDYEIHVSQVDGNDTTGNGDLLTPVASITKALTLVDSQRKTIIVHPGTYTENPSITTQYTTITGPGLIGGNIVISGTVSTSVGCTISGIKMTNLTVTTPTGTGNVNILNCEVSGTFTKSSNADYTVLRLCDLATASITGAGLVAIFGGNPNFITLNNASANLIVKSAVTVAPVLTAGNLSLVDSIVVAAVTNAVTSAAGSVITLANCQLLNSALNNAAPVVLNGFYSIFNTVYNKTSSTLVASSGTGGTTNSVDYFQYINADKFITQGGTSNQFVKGDGSLDSIVPATTGSNTFIGDQTINGSLIIEGVSEVITIDGGFNGNRTFDYTSGSIFYLTGLTGNGVWNIENVPTTNNKVLALTYVIEQGVTAYSGSQYQINGSNVIVKWVDNTIPTGSANNTEVIGLTAFRVGSSWSVIGSLSTFSV